VLDHLIFAIFYKQCIIGFVDMVLMYSFRNIGLYGGHMYIDDLLDD
jgi:hypothetical protein